MPAVTIAWSDLAPFAEIPSAKAEAMIADALAMATNIAPCLGESDLSEAKAAVGKAILRSAILRWHDAGSGIVSSQGVGPFQQTIDTQQRRSLFWPTEIEQLEKLCRADETDGSAWSYDVAGWGGVVHADVCAVMFGANYCSCGAEIAGFPLYETEP